jgi:hypothetical protein
MNILSNEEWADALKAYDETLKVTLKEKFRMMLFGALLQNNIGWWNEIRFVRLGGYSLSLAHLEDFADLLSYVRCVSLFLLCRVLLN